MSNLIPFKPFNEEQDIRIYYNGFLPHWRQDGCTYFVTFRLADSIPRPVLEEWRFERDQWLTARGIDVQVANGCEKLEAISKQDLRLFEKHFTGKLFEYLDKGLGACPLRNCCISRIVSDALVYFHGSRVSTGDFVVMPNHVHALLTPWEGYELEDILHSVKSYTSNQINKKLVRTGTLWMEESYDHIVRDGEDLIRIQNYIRKNPEKANLTSHEYRYQYAEYQLPKLT